MVRMVEGSGGGIGGRKLELPNVSHLKEEIEKVIKGQPAAAEYLSNVAYRVLSDQPRAGNGPLATMLLVGPTGVGKTESVKVFSELLMSNGQTIEGDVTGNFIRINCGEYASEYGVSNLLGAAAGLKGNETAMLKQEMIDSHAISLPDGRRVTVILIDEIEKAHPDVMKALLGALDSGEIRVKEGNRVVNLKNCVFMFTSNLGNTEVLEAQGVSHKDDAVATPRQMGFLAPVIKDDAQIPSKKILDQDTIARIRMNAITDQKKKGFAPEQVSRLGGGRGVVMFHELRDKKVLSDIVIDKLGKIERQYLEKGVHLEFCPTIELDKSSKAIEHILRHGYTPEEGIRPLERYLESHIASRLDTTKLRDGRKHNIILTELNRVLQVIDVDGGPADQELIAEKQESARARSEQSEYPPATEGRQMTPLAVDSPRGDEPNTRVQLPSRTEGVPPPSDPSKAPRHNAFIANLFARDTSGRNNPVPPSVYGVPVHSLYSLKVPDEGRVLYNALDDFSSQGVTVVTSSASLQEIKRSQGDIGMTLLELSIIAHEFDVISGGTICIDPNVSGLSATFAEPEITDRFTLVEGDGHPLLRLTLGIDKDQMKVAYAKFVEACKRYLEKTGLPRKIEDACAALQEEFGIHTFPLTSVRNSDTSSSCAERRLAQVKRLTELVRGLYVQFPDRMKRLKDMSILLEEQNPNPVRGTSTPKLFSDGRVVTEYEQTRYGSKLGAPLMHFVDSMTDDEMKDALVNAIKQIEAVEIPDEELAKAGHALTEAFGDQGRKHPKMFEFSKLYVSRYWPPLEYKMRVAKSLQTMVREFGSALTTEFTRTISVSFFSSKGNATWEKLLVKIPYDAQNKLPDQEKIDEILRGAIRSYLEKTNKK